jgi:hypothetical protein
MEEQASDKICTKLGLHLSRIDMSVVKSLAASFQYFSSYARNSRNVRGFFSSCLTVGCRWVNNSGLCSSRPSHSCHCRTETL